MPKIRVLVVDDSAMMRKVLSEIVNSDPQCTAVGVAAHGRIALAKIPQVNPDLITLDVEMPEMDGMTTLLELRKTYPKLPVIMVSNFTQAGAAVTLKALSNGATDYVSKPTCDSATEASNILREQLIPKIKLYCKHLLSREETPSLAAPAPRAPKAASGLPAAKKCSRVDVVCIGVSTGGPNALNEVFSNVLQPVPVPIVIVQHMPPVFTRALADRLNTVKSSVQFHEGEEGMEIEAGHAYIAPGGKHMEVRREGVRVVLRLHEGPPENSCRPAVDVMFRSIPAVYGGNILAVILTGMGQDGLNGCEVIAEVGGRIIAQDEASSVVWGMPSFIVKGGFADHVLPLDEVAARILQITRLNRDRGSISSAPPSSTPIR